MKNKPKFTMIKNKKKLIKMKKKLRRTENETYKETKM